MFFTALLDVAWYLQFKPRQFITRENSQPAVIDERSTSWEHWTVDAFAEHWLSALSCVEKLFFSIFAVIFVRLFY